MGLRCGAVVLAAAGALAIWRLWRGSVARRRAIAPVVVPCVAFLGLVVARYAHDLLRGYPTSTASTRACASPGAARCWRSLPVSRGSA